MDLPGLNLHELKVFGRSPEGWLKLQLQYDLWRTRQSVDLNDLKPAKAA
jgi:plasmid maintenance system antidote protein VapI